MSIYTCMWDGREYRILSNKSTVYFLSHENPACLYIPPFLSLSTDSNRKLNMKPSRICWTQFIVCLAWFGGSCFWLGHIISGPLSGIFCATLDQMIWFIGVSGETSCFCSVLLWCFCWRHCLGHPGSPHPSPLPAAPMETLSLPHVSLRKETPFAHKPIHRICTFEYSIPFQIK